MKERFERLADEVLALASLPKIPLHYRGISHTSLYEREHFTRSYYYDHQTGRTINGGKTPWLDFLLDGCLDIAACQTLAEFLTTYEKHADTPSKGGDYMCRVDGYGWAFREAHWILKQEGLVT